MLVSHAYKFVVFPDPLGGAPWLSRALQPWLDQTVASNRRASAETRFFCGMSPAEAELAFDLMGLSFSSYTRIAIVRNPYAKMTQIYDRIAATDPVWRTRDAVGLKTPSFKRWLKSTRPDRLGAGGRFSPRWRRHGAWSAQAWCADRVTHLVRAEDAAQTLLPIFQQLGCSPAFGMRTLQDWQTPRSVSLYDNEARAIIRDRYAADLALYRVDLDEMLLAA